MHRHPHQWTETQPLLTGSRDTWIGMPFRLIFAMTKPTSLPCARRHIEV